MTKYIKGELLYKLLNGGYENLLINKQYVNALNVFPVPDGDTGENMVGTLLGGLKMKEIPTSVGILMTEFSRNCLFNARGNSGVILSQFIRGIAIGLQTVEEASVKDFVFALTSGVKYAYKAVVNPVEGTMLTVIREGIEAVSEKVEIYQDFSHLFKDLILYMKDSLNNTPNLLAVLKDAGVVDSGGAGIVIIFEGIKAVLDGKQIESSLDNPYDDHTQIKLLSGSDKDFGYCTEFILQLTNKSCDFNLQSLIDYLTSIGDSVVCVQDDVIIKVHVHTLTPYKALEFSHGFGEFISVKIENMNLQHSEQQVVSPQKIVKDIAIVAVASGKGIKEYFSEIGADVIVDGGQCFNPSTQDFISAFEKIEAKHIIVLPNNKNVILSAKQAAELYKNAKVQVIETKTIAEGYSCLSMIDTTEEDIDSFISNMTLNLPNVTTGVIALAVRDSVVDGISIKQGDYIGYTCKKVVSTSKNKLIATLNLLDNIDEIDEKETLVIFYGKDVLEDEKDSLENALYEKYPLMDIAFINGEQDVFSFVLCIE